MDVPFQKELDNGLAIGISKDQEKPSRFDGSSDPDEVPKGKTVHDMLFPISKKKGALVSIRYHFSFGQDDENRLCFYEIDAKLVGKNKGGKDFTHPFHLSHHPEMNDHTIKAIIQERAHEQSGKYQ
ncbi:hypothetical protein [Siminovitchia sp. 179-K 8D1 HS]|uniref:hypothetical protein n=1 Tax=Siminovitchia sp. 179-K 8D1 HS TaxID=3142385 RepID=UPI0039A08F1D